MLTGISKKRKVGPWVSDLTALPPAQSGQKTDLAADAPAEVRPPVVTEPRWSRVRKAVEMVMLLVAALLGFSAVHSALAMLGQVTTTGCEEEGLFSIWRFCRGEPVYADSSAIPFAASYFNWLFYAAYGGICKSTLFLLNLDESLLPAIARLVTLGFAAGCIGLLYAILQFLPVRLCLGNASRLALSLVLVLNPLTGAWISTARPDLGALAFELAGLFCALQYLRSHKRWHLYATVAACYTAWGFKHNSVNVLLGFGIFLAVRRRWREFLVLGGLSGGLWCVSLFLGGSLYRFALLESQMHCQFSPALGFDTIKAAFSLAPQLAPLAIGLAIMAACRRPGTMADTPLFLTYLCVGTLGVALIGICKQGAYLNYLLLFSILGMIWLLCSNDAECEPRWERRMAGGLRLATCSLFAMVLTKGLPASINLLYETSHRTVARWKSDQPAREALAPSNTVRAGGQPEMVARLTEHLSHLPGPVWINERAVNLPWLQTKPPQFVYAFTYPLDRKAGRKYEAGGIGALIEAGYFGSLVVSLQHCACESPSNPKRPCKHLTMNHLPLVLTSEGLAIDGGSLRHYELQGRDGMFSFYVKRKS